MASLNTTTADLGAALRKLSQRWEEVKEVWRDPVRHSFEKEYWATLENPTQSTLKEMERLARVIAQAQRYVK